MSSRAVVLFAALTAAGAAWVGAPARAHARAAGLATEGCNGCHSGGAEPTVTVTTSAAIISPGQAVTVTVTISATNGGANGVGGMYLHASKGRFTLMAGEGTRADGTTGTGVTHSAPKRAAGGAVTFRVGWTAPATPGGVDFNVFALSGNGDNSSRGDGGGYGFLSVTYGCSGMTYYRDFDGDGAGATGSGSTRDCALPPSYSATGGDCDDNDERVYPGAAELCNKRDDDCDGMVDEGLPIMTYYTDADGDGHGARGGATATGCAPPKGFGVGQDDCDDSNPDAYTGAQELCNYKDDNCNGQIDENARQDCGVGWCRRLGAGCGTNQCTPGEPRAETCNAFDDDCDGVNDNGANLCGAGMACVEGYCVAAGSGGGTGSGGASPAGSGGRGGAEEGGTIGCAVAPGKGGGGAAVLVALVAAVLAAARRRRRRGGRA